MTAGPDRNTSGVAEGRVAQDTRFAVTVVACYWPRGLSRCCHALGRSGAAYHGIVRVAAVDHRCLHAVVFGGSAEQRAPHRLIVLSRDCAGVATAVS